MIVNDELFGELTYKRGWKGNVLISMFEKEENVKLFVRGKEDIEFQKNQREAFSMFIKKQQEIITKVKGSIFKYYQAVCDEYRAMFGDRADENAPIINSVDQIETLVKLTQIIVEKSSDKDRILTLLFNSKWDIEMGVGIILKNEEVDFVGVQSEVL